MYLSRIFLDTRNLGNDAILCDFNNWQNQWGMNFMCRLVGQKRIRIVHSGEPLIFTLGQ